MEPLRVRGGLSTPSMLVARSWRLRLAVVSQKASGQGRFEAGGDQPQAHREFFHLGSAEANRPGGHTHPI